MHPSLQRYILKVYDSARLPNKFNAISERTKLLRLYFLCFVGEFEIENNKGENKRTPSHSNVFVALELISLLSVTTTHRVLFYNTSGSADLHQLSVKFITV